MPVDHVELWGQVTLDVHTTVAEGDQVGYGVMFLH